MWKTKNYDVESKEEMNIVRTIKRKKAKWTGHILLRNCFLKHFTEGKIEGITEITGRRGRKHKQLLDVLNPLAPKLFFF